MPPNRLTDAATREIPEGLPSLCAICHGWGRQRICIDCLNLNATAQPRCSRCALRLSAAASLCGACLTRPPPFASSLAAVDYAHPWNGLLTAFKFHGAIDLAPSFAACIVSTVRHGAMPIPAMLLPIPLSAERLRERGYNQAWELARRVAATLRCRADATLLLRIKDSAHQLTLAPAARAANVRGVFAVEPRRLAEVRGSSIGLLDDVMTTGATAAEAARVLLQAGATAVHVWVLARTPAPAPAGH